MDLNDIRAAATVACFVLFTGIVVWAYSRRNAQRFEEAAQLPFDGEE